MNEPGRCSESSMPRCPTVALGLLFALACSCAPPGDAHREQLRDPGLERWIRRQSQASAERLLRNVSSGATVEKRLETKFVADDRMELVRDALRARDGRLRLVGELLVQTVTAAPGSVVAAPAGKPPEPDYFFHWTRDSALVMDVLITRLRTGPPAGRQVIRQRLEEFVSFTRKLQESQVPTGLGEPRVNADGTADFLKWSRPQHDGPALRALTLLRYREDLEPGAAKALLEDVIRRDLDFIRERWSKDAFDLWEEYRGQDYYTRVVQLSALEAGARNDPARSVVYSEGAGKIAEALEAQWLPEQGIYGFGAGTRAYWDGTRKEKPGRNLDAAVLLAVLHGKRVVGRHSVLDDRVLSTAVKLEDQFDRLYAINRTRAPDEGVAMGRYEGDDYYGGNPFQLITLCYAELHYRLAAALVVGNRVDVTRWDLEFLSRALTRSGSGARLAADEGLPDAFREPLIRGLILRGDDLLRTLRRHTPESGELSEQFDKETGRPVSGRDLSWSHAALLTAVEARRAALEQYHLLLEARP